VCSWRATTTSESVQEILEKRHADHPCHLSPALKAVDKEMFMQIVPGLYSLGDSSGGHVRAFLIDDGRVDAGRYAA
jgi:hypothetical protein